MSLLQLLYVCISTVPCILSLSFWLTDMILCAHVVCDFSVYVTVLLGGSLRAARQWQACRKHLGQTVLSAQGCGFTASGIMWLSTRSQALTEAVDIHTNMYQLK